MPRQPRNPLAPGLYHLTARGIRSERIFTGSHDCRSFLDLLAGVSHPHHLVCRAFCLMPTHYHLLVETESGGLSDPMGHLNGVYAKRFNKEHQYGGRLFRERFHSKPVRTGAHLHATIGYVALNPVRAGLCAHPVQWPWSSFRAIMGRGEPPPFLDTTWTLELFSQSPRAARRELERLVTPGYDAAFEPLAA
jgi:putative transposase